MNEYCQPDPTLPIFAWQRRGMRWFYAPGYLVVVPKEDRRQIETDISQATPHSQAAVALRAHAVAAQKARQDLCSQPYRPVCLTIYLNNRCNLRCDYCYAIASPAHTQSIDCERVSLPAIRSAARLVSHNCQARHLPFTLVLHGGGEPTLDWKLANQILNIVEQEVKEKELPIFRYIATNGVMSHRVANWLLSRFDLIGLSCDGPPHIQNNQRPLKNGADSAPYIERLATMAREAGKPINVRVTLTRSSMLCQEEIADYLCQQLAPQVIRVEPVYQGGRANAESSLELEMVEPYVAQFMQARRLAANYGVSWCSASTRLGSIYGPFCHIFRDVLNLVPGDCATACFRTSQLRQDSQQNTLIGWQDLLTDSFSLDEGRIQNVRQAVLNPPDRCAACFNQFHCTKGCPDRCPLETPGKEFSSAAEVRCQLQAALALAMLDELVPELESDRVYTAAMDAHRLGWE